MLVGTPCIVKARGGQQNPAFQQGSLQLPDTIRRFKCVEGSQCFVELTLHQMGLGTYQLGLVTVAGGEIVCRQILEQPGQLAFGIEGVAGSQQVVDDNKVGFRLARLQLDGTTGLKGAGLEFALALEKA